MSTFADRKTTHPKNAREVYVEQVSHGRGLAGSMNKKRRTFTHLNHDEDVDFPYRSTSDYLRQRVTRTSPSPTEMILARNIPRTKSASELSPRNNFHRSNNGNPKYKAQEDYYDEIQTLKKDMKAMKEENSTLRAKVRRSEEDNARKRKEIDSLYDTNKDGDLRRTLTEPSTDRKSNIPPSSANVVMSLKQRLFKVETQLKNKESAIENLKSDPKWTSSLEFEMQNRALLGELERQKVERLNYLQQNDYVGTIDEEKKAAIRKLDSEKKELKKENDTLKKKIEELENVPRSSVSGQDTETQKSIESFKRESKSQQDEIQSLKDELKDVQRERKLAQDRLDHTNEKLEEVQRDRDRCREKLDQANKKLETIKKTPEPTRHRRSSPVSDNDDPARKAVRSLSLKSLPRDDDEINSPTRKANEHSAQSKQSAAYLKTAQPNPPLKTSNKDVRVDDAAKDDRVKHVREKHAAIVIQKTWRQHKDVRKGPARPTAASRVTNFDKKPTGNQSPRASTPKIDKLGSDTTKGRPSSPSVNNESAVKTVQASLRGYLNRNEMNDSGTQTSSPLPKPRTPPRRKSTTSDDDDLVVTPKQTTSMTSKSEIKRDSVDGKPRESSRSTLPIDKTKSSDRLNTSNRDLPSKTNRASSSASDTDPPSKSQPNKSSGGSNQNLQKDQTKDKSTDPNFKASRASGEIPRHTPSPPPSSSRRSSAQVDKDNSSKKALPTERNKLGSISRFSTVESEATSKSPRASSSQLMKPQSSVSNVDRSDGSNKALSKDPNKSSPRSTPIPNDQDSASKPASSSDVRRSSRHIPSEDARPSSKKNLNDSKTSTKDTSRDAHSTDEDDIVFS